MALAGCALAARFVPISNHIVLLAAALSPYLMLGAVVSAVFLLAARRWIVAIVAVAVALAMLTTQLPLYLGSTAATAATTLRVMSGNLREGQADAASLVRLAEQRADVLAVQELTPQEAGRLSQAGLDAAFPYRLLDARDDAQGAGLWSRLPIADARGIGGFGMPFLRARILIPGTSAGPTVVVVHLPGPWPQPIDDWRADMARLPTLLSTVAAESGDSPVLVAGDFNATWDMQPFRNLLTNGYRDAAEQSRAGIRPTFPADSWLPPVIAIDHIITRNCAATSLRTVDLPGSDHRGIVATITIPKS